MANGHQIPLPSLTVESVHEKQAKVKNYMLQSKLDKVLGLLQTEEQIYLQIFRKDKQVVEIAKSKILLRSQLSNCNPSHGDQFPSPSVDGKGTADNRDSKIPRSQSMPDARQFVNNESKRLPRLDRRPVQRMTELIVFEDHPKSLKNTSAAPASGTTGNRGNINYKQSKSVNVDLTKTDKLGLRIDNITRPHFCPPSPRLTNYAGDMIIENQAMDLEKNCAVDFSIVTTDYTDNIPLSYDDTSASLSQYNDLRETSHNRVIPRPSSASCRQLRYANQVMVYDDTHPLRSQSATVIAGTMGSVETELKLPQIIPQANTDHVRERHEGNGERVETVYAKDLNDEVSFDIGNTTSRRKLSLKRRRESVFPASVQHLKNELRELANERAEQLKKRFDFDQAIAREKQGFKDVVKRVDAFFIQMHHSGMLQNFSK